MGVTRTFTLGVTASALLAACGSSKAAAPSSTSTSAVATTAAAAPTIGTSSSAAAFTTDGNGGLACARIELGLAANKYGGTHTEATNDFQKGFDQSQDTGLFSNDALAAAFRPLGNLLANGSPYDDVVAEAKVLYQGCLNAGWTPTDPAHGGQKLLTP